MGKNILLIDTDKILHATLSEQFRLYEEFKITCVTTLKEGTELLYAKKFNVIILDATLTETDGRIALCTIRSAGAGSSIVILMNSGVEPATWLSADTNAYGIVEKPFRFRDLMDCIRTQISQREAYGEVQLSIGPYTFKPNTKMLWSEEAERCVRLTEKETSILRFLFLAGERVVDRNTLLDEVWGYNLEVTTHTLETHVYRLRQKIERDPANAEIIITEPGGYRLIP